MERARASRRDESSLKSQRRDDVGWRPLPFLGRAALGDRMQLALENFAPENDASVRAAKTLALPILDAALARLHRDVLHHGQIGMHHLGETQLARPDIAHHVH